MFFIRYVLKLKPFSIVAQPFFVSHIFIAIFFVWNKQITSYSFYSYLYLQKAIIHDVSMSIDDSLPEIFCNSRGLLNDMGFTRRPKFMDSYVCPDVFENLTNNFNDEEEIIPAESRNKQWKCMFYFKALLFNNWKLYFLKLFLLLHHVRFFIQHHVAAIKFPVLRE